MSFSTMHHTIGAAGRRQEKRSEMEYELRGEKSSKKKMTGLVYHAAGTKKDKKGNSYTPHYGSKEDGHKSAGVVSGRYVHIGEDAVDISFEDMVEEACWKGYKQIGMKKKGGKQVPNCVPENVEENEEDRMDAVHAHASKFVKTLPDSNNLRLDGLGVNRDGSINV